MLRLRSCLLVVIHVVLFFTPERHIAVAFIQEKSPPRSFHFRLASSESSLALCSDIRLTSNRLPCNDIKKVSEFLVQPETRDLIVSAGGSRPFENIDRSPELEHLWNDACMQYYSADDGPSKNDRIVAVETAIKFPGLTLLTKTLSAVKVLNGGEALPHYNFLVIGEEQTLKGARPIVWLFQQLSGSQKKRGGFEPSKARVKTTVSVQELEDGLVIDLDCKFRIDLNFPSFLLKLLPASRQAIEQQASEGIRKTVSKDLEKAMEATERSLSDYLNV